MNKKYRSAFFVYTLISSVSLVAMEEEFGKIVPELKASKSLEERVGLGGDKQNVSYWLGQGANPNFLKENGDRLLHEAIFWQKVEIVGILLAHGADPKLRDKSGKTPTELARAEGRYDIVDLLYVYGAEH